MPDCARPLLLRTTATSRSREPLRASGTMLAWTATVALGSRLVLGCAERGRIMEGTNQEQDVALVSRMAKGDRAALATLYTRHAPTLVALARRIVADPSESEDLVHNVFLEAWRHASDYSSDRGSVLTWLALRARSRAIDSRRRSAKTRSQLDGERLTSPTEGEENPWLSESGDLRQALAVISKEEQVVIMLGYFEGLSSSEIAERVGAPIGTVKSRTRLALSKLRVWFSEREGAA